MTICRHLALLLAAAAAGCLGSNPPGPPVRWFDPTPPRVAADARPPVRVAAAPFLRQDFALRTPPHELAIDDSLRWIAPPEQLVAAALQQTAALPVDLELEVVRFEFEVHGGFAAVVEVGCRTGGRWVPVRVEREAAGSRPEQLVAAMAAALQELPRATAAALAAF